MRTEVPRALSLADTQLLGVADRLVAEFAELPTGSVLRCYARAVYVARHQRGSNVADDAERLARSWLSLRRSRRPRP